MIKQLFFNLSLRFCNENNLSDFTWAFCKANETFQRLFLNFFFPNVDFSNIRYFTREFVKDDSRADFVIDNGGVIYVIECKINDKQHHFEQYTKAYNIPNNRLGYIVNYNFAKKDFEIKTWTDFYFYIESNIPNDEEKIFFEAYLEFLKNVCGIIKIKKMDLKGIYSLYNLNIALKSVINRSTDKYMLSYYNSDFKESYYGYKFKVESQNKEDIWLNFGLWFERENPIFTVGVWKKDGWGKPLCEIIEQGKKHIPKYASQAYWEDSSYYFEGTHKLYEEFTEADTVDQQKEVLCKFVDEVVDFYVES